MKKIIIQFITIFTLLFFLFKFNLNIKSDLTKTLTYTLKNVLPSLFPIIFITNYIKCNIDIKNKIIYFLSLCLSFAPSNAVLASNEKEILFSTNLNPLFSFIMLNKILNKKIALIIITINLLFNYILLYKFTNYSYKKASKCNINDLIKKTTEAIINIMGIIIFFSIIISITKFFLPKIIISTFEITNGFLLIKSINKFKIFYLIFLNSFCGTAIIYQIKSLNDKTSKKIIVYKFITSIIVTIITYIILLIIKKV